MQIKFKIDGESPEIGAFKCGDNRILSEDMGKLFCDRELAEEIKTTTTKATIKKEDKDNGRD